MQDSEEAVQESEAALNGTAVSSATVIQRALVIHPLLGRMEWMLALTFAVVIAYIWLEELYDLPHLLLGTGPTPVNWAESILETVVLVVLGAAVIVIVHRLLNRVRCLEGCLPVCTDCGRIRYRSKWVTVDEYMREAASGRISPSLCSDCAMVHYGDLLPS